jgi:PAS domain S-box-containing protein
MFLHYFNKSYGLPFMPDKRQKFIKKMAALQAAYKANLSQKVQELETVIQSIELGDLTLKSKHALETLHGLSHKLAGGAGTFGFSAISDVTRDFAQHIIQMLDTNESITPGAKEKILEHFDKIKEEAEKETKKEESRLPSLNISSVGQSRRRDDIQTVIVVDDDEVFIGALESQLTYFGFKVLALTEHTKLRETLVANPRSVVLMDVSFPGDSTAGLTTVESLRNEGLLTSPVIFMSIRGDFDIRLQAVRIGCEEYLVKPLDLAELVDILYRVTGQTGEEAYRVLVVDDSPSAAAFNAALLNEAGLVTVVVNDPYAVMAPIRELRPDVILMDIQMPECSGFELAQVIRHDREFVHTPIMFLSGADIEDGWIKFAQSGGDDFLRKGISPNELVISVISRAKRARDLNSTNLRLKESEALYRAVTRTAPEAIITADDEKRIIHWNDGAENLFGYDASETFGKSLSFIISEKHQDMTAKSSELVEISVPQKDGEDILCDVSLTNWDIAEKQYSTLIFRDISVRKEQEVALKESSDRLASAIDNMNDGFVLYDQDDRLVLCNNQYRR